MKNSLGDLNSYLFEQLDVLSNQDLKGEELKEAMSRANVITNVAKQIVSSSNTLLQAQKLKANVIGETELPSVLEG